MSLTSSNADNDVVAAAAPMPASIAFPTAVAAGDALLVAIIEVSAESTTINASDLAGSVNATGWQLLSGPTDSAISTFRTWVFGKISEGAGSETVTVTRTGTPNGALGCAVIKTDGGAITFGDVATVRETASNTDCDTNTITAEDPGAVMGVIFTLSDQSLTADGSGETDVSDESARIHFLFDPYDSTGLPTTKGIEATCGTNATKLMHLVQLIEGGGAPAPTIIDVDGDDTITNEQQNVVTNVSNEDTETIEVRQGGFDYVLSGNAASADMPTIGATGPISAPHAGSATWAVVNGDAQEDTHSITITDETGTETYLIGTPNADPDLRLTASADAVAGDYVRVSNVQGGAVADVTVNDDLTWDAEEGVTAFDVQYWDSGDGTWGDRETQTVDDGSGLVEVPDVVGDDEATATTALEGAGFVVTVSSDYSASVAVGNVLSQSPVGGAMALEGSTVAIVVSLGAAEGAGGGLILMRRRGRR